MSSTLKSKIVNGLVLSAVFLGGFITCMTTPLVDKMNLVSAWEHKRTLYLTSAATKIFSNAKVQRLTGVLHYYQTGMKGLYYDPVRHTIYA